MDPYDHWKTTAPDCYAPYPTALCTACDRYVERVDMKHIDGDRGVCFWCWRKGERPAGYDGEEGAT